ncbi:PadR family transcriptional regulator [Lactococcus lactis]|uniref:PadR family transcriptional regulator n=1 Tax=Lactococcus lactis TaxID=1358 RepID=UPI002659A2E9|nr:PadR family transcriptional regulator [Lactococcus lactis]WKF72346.1 PadR family transcriptional regulator [Lactococcus lactis]
MPRPRILPNIILGLLYKNGKMSGKDMIEEFKNEISEFWSVSHSQLYPELQRMTDEERISRLSNEGFSDSKIVIYEITDSGLYMLAKWFEETITEKNDNLTPLKLYFIPKASSPILENILKQEQELHKNKLSHLKERQSLLMPPQGHITEQYGHYLILDQALNREIHYLEWINNQLSKL